MRHVAIRLFLLLVLVVCFPCLAYAESAKIARGKYLVKIAACGSCHGKDPSDPESPLSGGLEIRDSFGKVLVPNITTDKESGIGTWTVLELQHAIRSSLGKNGEYLSVESHQPFRWMSDEDVYAISAYLQSGEPVFSEVPRRNVSSFTARKWGVFSQHEIVKGYVPGISQSAGGYYGMYLVSQISNCARCHSPSDSHIDSSGYLAGSKGRKFVPDMLPGLSPYPLAPDLRNHDGGLIGWTEDDLIRYLGTGKGLAPGSDSSHCPTPYFSYMTEKDKKSIIKYLRSLE
jgi:mono/diheme cytochrome c family protein/cytochrome c2